MRKVNGTEKKLISMLQKEIRYGVMFEYPALERKHYPVYFEESDRINIYLT